LLQPQTSARRQTELRPTTMRLPLQRFALDRLTVSMPTSVNGNHNMVGRWSTGRAHTCDLGIIDRRVAPRWQWSILAHPLSSKRSASHRLHLALRNPRSLSFSPIPLIVRVFNRNINVPDQPVPLRPVQRFLSWRRSLEWVTDWPFRKPRPDHLGRVSVP
jgi:hypothetical protein